MNGLSSSRSLWFVLVVTFVCAVAVQAKVTRIVIEQKQSPAYDGKSFGNVGQSEILTGKSRKVYIMPVSFNNMNLF